MLSWQFITNSSVEFAVCKVRIFRLHAVKNTESGESPRRTRREQSLLAGRASMWKMQKVCGSKCMAISALVLSHALVTLLFKYGM